MQLTHDFIAQALPTAHMYIDGSLVTGANDVLWRTLETQLNINVSIDSRTVKQGEFFVPLKGPSFDGHDFVADALKKGACGALIARDRKDCIDVLAAVQKKGTIFIVVDDTLQAFISLAKAWRERLTCPVVGITGSVGKTTTKEMLRSILQAAGKDVYASYKNYNNVFGVCYNLLRIPLATSVVVLEMGINETGEMRQLVDIVRPTIGVITTVAHAHLAGLGNSIECVAYEKRQLFSSFTPQDIGIINGDVSLLTDVCYAHPIARFGLKTRNHVQARKLVVNYDEMTGFTTTFMMKWYQDKGNVCLHSNHPGFVSNALAAATVAYFLHLSFETVVKGLENYQGLECRFEVRTLRNHKGIVLNDCYNANPESMKAALMAFAQFKTEGPKIAVLGDMLELGTRENFWHRQVGRSIAKSGVKLQSLILVGPRARMIGKTAPFSLPLVYADDWQQAKEKLEALLTQSGCAVLVKASQGMGLGSLVKAVTE